MIPKTLWDFISCGLVKALNKLLVLNVNKKLLMIIKSQSFLEFGVKLKEYNF